VRVEYPIYHGILFPILVDVRSLKYPTAGVAIASAIYPIMNDVGP